MSRSRVPAAELPPLAPLAGRPPSRVAQRRGWRAAALRAGLAVPAGDLDIGSRLRPGVLSGPAFGRRALEISLTLGPRRSLGIPSLVEQRLADDASAAVRDASRVTTALAAIREARVGGAFWGSRRLKPGKPEGLVWLRPTSSRLARVMLQEALRAVPAASLCVSAPAEPWAARLREALNWRGVAVAIEPVDPWPLLDQAAAVYVDGSDPVAFLALSAGVRVRCVTAGDVSGWGLTDDAAGVDQRRRRSFAELAQAMLFDSVLYTDPFTGRTMACEEAITRLADWRSVLERRRGLAAGAGARWWTGPAIAQMLSDGVQSLPLSARPAAGLRRAAQRHGALAVWDPRAGEPLSAAAAAQGVPLWRLEDGFIRSAGLGSDLTPPSSVLLDRQRPHYDPKGPSDLEDLLQTAELPPALLARAARLVDAIVARGLSKYNTGRRSELDLPPGRRIVLVPGQVADDASVRAGGCGLSSLDLVRATRIAEPNGLILYKPHPDVDAGHRRGAYDDEEVLRHADRVVRGHALPSLLRQVDAVHTLTSLAGFEALLRGREVVAHGQPFYAGWGLTTDLRPLPRRTRQLSLVELAAVALILYPFYRDPVTGLPCPPEVLAGRLLAGVGTNEGPLVRLRQLQGHGVGVARALARRVRRPPGSGVPAPVPAP